MANCMILLSTVMAPTAMSPPYLSKEELKHTVIRLSVACMMKGDMPSARLGSTTLAWGRRFAARRRHLVLGPVRNFSTHTALTAWDKMVASAAPRTPMSKAKMNTGSSTVLSPAPMSTVFMPTTVNP